MTEWIDADLMVFLYYVVGLFLLAFLGAGLVWIGRGLVALYRMGREEWL